MHRSASVSLQAIFVSSLETDRAHLLRILQSMPTSHITYSPTKLTPCLFAESLKQTLAGKGGACSSMALAKPKEVSAPPKAGAYEAKKESPPTEFRRFYTRGDLPLQVGYPSTSISQAAFRHVNDFSFLLRLFWPLCYPCPSHPVPKEKR
jgi:hypothetical protein